MAQIAPEEIDVDENDCDFCGKPCNYNKDFQSEIQQIMKKKKDYTKEQQKNELIEYLVNLSISYIVKCATDIQINQKNISDIKKEIKNNILENNINIATLVIINMAMIYRYIQFNSYINNNKKIKNINNINIRLYLNNNKKIKKLLSKKILGASWQQIEKKKIQIDTAKITAILMELLIYFQYKNHIIDLEIAYFVISRIMKREDNKDKSNIILVFTDQVYPTIETLIRYSIINKIIIDEYITSDEYTKYNKSFFKHNDIIIKNLKLIDKMGDTLIHDLDYYTANESLIKKADNQTDDIVLEILSNFFNIKYKHMYKKQLESIKIIFSAYKEKNPNKCKKKLNKKITEMRQKEKSVIISDKDIYDIYDYNTYIIKAHQIITDIYKINLNDHDPKLNNTEKEIITIYQTYQKKTITDKMKDLQKKIFLLEPNWCDCTR